VRGPAAGARAPAPAPRFGSLRRGRRASSTPIASTVAFQIPLRRLQQAAAACTRAAARQKAGLPTRLCAAVNSSSGGWQPGSCPHNMAPLNRGARPWNPTPSSPSWPSARPRFASWLAAGPSQRPSSPLALFHDIPQCNVASAALPAQKGARSPGRRARTERCTLLRPQGGAGGGKQSCLADDAGRSLWSLAGGPRRPWHAYGRAGPRAAAPAAARGRGATHRHHLPGAPAAARPIAAAAALGPAPALSTGSLIHYAPNTRPPSSGRPLGTTTKERRFASPPRSQDGAHAGGAAA
jgi:hypothetical protein